MKTNWKALAVASPIMLAGCATTTQFEVNESKTWNLQDAPILSEVISTPISNVIEIAEKISTQSWAASRKEKFETDEAYKARLEKSKKGYGNAFFVKPLRTYDCTKYDFQKNVYSINCKAFRAGDALAETTAPTGKKTQLANAYTSREVEFFKSKSYHVSVATDAVADLKIGSEDAKKIDNDLMVGVLVSVQGADFKLGGCSEIDVTYDDACKKAAFKFGAAFETYKYVIDPEAIIETVIFLKSTNKVVAHKKYSLKKS